MTTPSLPARRATIEDLPKLTTLWAQEGFAAEELGKRLQEFQVVDGPGGELAGAIGLQIAGHEGRLHSEAFLHPEEAESIRAQLWERVQMISKNHGLVRVWTQLSAPFWSQNGFGSPAPEIEAKRPPVFSGNPAPWSFLQLRDEVAAPSIEKEFAMFREMQKEETERIMRQAKVMKLVAAIIVMVVFVVVAIGMFAWLKKYIFRPK